MIQRFFSKYGLAVHLALLAALPLALTPFLTAATTLASVILWLSAFGAVWFFTQPDLRRGEHISTSRVRLRRELLVDPVCWFMVMALLYALLGWLNTGIALEYSVADVKWFVKEPSWQGMPASADGAGELPFAVALAVAIVVLGVRDGLGAHGRIMFGVVGGMVAGLGGLAAAACVCAGDMSLVAAVSDMGFAAAPFWASFFGVWLVVGLSCVAAAETSKWTHSRVPHILGIAGNVAALMYFAPPLVAVAWGGLAFVVLFFCSLYIVKTATMGAMVRYLVLAVFAIFIPVCMTMVFMDADFFGRRGALLDVALAFFGEYENQSEVLARLARGMWQERPWLGVGADAFQFHAPFLAAQEDWASLPEKPLYAFNGYWTLLAERGIVGCLLFAVGFSLLAVIFALRCVRFFAGFGKIRSIGHAFFAVPPVIWCAPFAVVLIALEAVFSPVFTVGVGLLACVVPLVLAGASFPDTSSFDDGSVLDQEPAGEGARHRRHRHSSHRHWSHGHSLRGGSEHGREHHFSEK
jgi:hypothetical protein